MTDKNDGLGLSPAEAALREAALEYHRSPTRGKIAVTPTKPLANQRDLSLVGERLGRRDKIGRAHV